MKKPLPLLDERSRQDRVAESPAIKLDEYSAVACSVNDEGCLTCGDVAVPVTVLEPGEQDAMCADAYGNEGKVAVELVGPVATGERLLVHAGVAIDKLEDKQ